MSKKTNKKREEDYEEEGGGKECPYCAPQYAGQKICYSKDVLGKMVEAWNDEHPDDKIEYDRKMKKYQLWKKLRERLSGEQWCWLGQDMFSNIEGLEDFFKPPQPYRNGLNTWLSTRDINDVMHQYEKIYPEFIFLGAVPIDFEQLYNPVSSFDINDKNIKNGKIQKIGMIFNTDPHTKSGEHWIAMFINVPKKYIKFFDSTGNPPSKEVKELIEKIQKQIEDSD
jgi:hypothetical protein